jgi:cytochrome c
VSGPRAAAALAVGLAIGAAGCRNDHVTPQQVVPGGRPALGVAAINRYGCGACHVIPGVRTARGKTGPPLSDFGDRAYIAGALPNRPEHLVRWIRDPHSVEPGTVMPNLGVSDADARHIASYLYTLGDGTGLGPSHLLPIEWLRALGGGAKEPRGPPAPK